MRSSLECLPCFLRQALEAGRNISVDEAVLEKALKRILRETSEFELTLSPPVMGQKIHRILREEMMCDDPYAQIKQNATRVAMSFADEATKLIQQADSPFETAIRFSIAGNILDFALMSVWDDALIRSSFINALEKPLDSGMAQRLQDQLETAKSVLILADNAGETVFDKLFIEQLPKHLDIYYAVKASPVINDATYDDAVEAGIDKIATVIDNGTDAPGTPLEQCSQQFLQYFHHADVVIAKGQANFETLNEALRQVYFFTQIKCPVIARHYRYEVGDWILSDMSTLGKMSHQQ